MRKMFFQLRHDVEYEEEFYTIDAPIASGVNSTNQAGHYQIIFLTHRFLPKELLSELWGLDWGRG